MLIKECMTRSPHTVTVDLPLVETREILWQHNIRHVPVLDGGKLVGILSDRNLKEALATPAGEKLLAADAMMPDVFVVSPDADLSKVLEQLAAEKYGCAVIQENNQTVVGIFTTADACRLLAKLLQGKA